LPNQDGFIFQADRDGYYWLQHAIVTVDGKQDPEFPSRNPPSQRMVIDTVKPVIHLTSAQRVGGDLVVTWDIAERHPDPATLKLEYRSDDQPPDAWVPVIVHPGPTGSAKVRLTTDRPLQVRLSLKDLAGNFSVAQAAVAGASAGNGGLQTTNFVPGAGHPAGLAPVVGPGPVVPPVPRAQPEVKQEATPPPAPVPTQVQTPQLPPTTPDRMNTPPHQWQGQQAVSNTPPAVPSLPQAQNPLNNQAVARSDAPPAQAPAAVALPTGSAKVPPVTIVNQREIVLEYEVKAGPSGIGRVELWVTEDGGKTWGKGPAADDGDEKSGRGQSVNGKNERTLQLPRDGVYGVYMIVRNSVGLGKPEPRPGDAPEMVIEVDTTPPVAKLWAPVPVPGQRDTVLLRWEATDKNLTANPITLEWAEKQDGQWHVIGSPNLPNTGQFQWTLPKQIPARVFLRVRARDSAGNEAVAAFQQPQLVDLSVPEGQLLQVRPAPAAPRY
jgi:hypothetical protein